VKHRGGDHEDDQQHEHHVDQWRDVDIREVVELVLGLALEGHG